MGLFCTLLGNLRIILGFSGEIKMNNIRYRVEFEKEETQMGLFCSLLITALIHFMFSVSV